MGILARRRASCYLVARLLSYVYLVMPRFGCGDVFGFITEFAGEVNDFDESVAMSVVRPVLSALSHLHTRGFAHRDVKSENILVDYVKDESGM